MAILSADIPRRDDDIIKTTPIPETTNSQAGEGVWLWIPGQANTDTPTAPSAPPAAGLVIASGSLNFTSNTSNNNTTSPLPAAAEAVCTSSNPFDLSFNETGSWIAGFTLILMFTGLIALMLADFYGKHIGLRLSPKGYYYKKEDECDAPLPPQGFHRGESRKGEKLVEKPRKVAVKASLAIVGKAPRRWIGKSSFTLSLYSSATPSSPPPLSSETWAVRISPREQQQSRQQGQRFVVVSSWVFRPIDAFPSATGNGNLGLDFPPAYRSGGDDVEQTGVAGPYDTTSTVGGTTEPGPPLERLPSPVSPLPSLRRVSKFPRFNEQQEQQQEQQQQQSNLHEHLPLENRSHNAGCIDDFIIGGGGSSSSTGAVIVDDASAGGDPPVRDFAELYNGSRASLYSHKSRGMEDGEDEGGRSILVVSKWQSLVSGLGK